MHIERVRDILAVMFVGVFLSILLVLGILPPLFKIGEPTVIQEHVRFLASLLTGPVGMILGFYFGKTVKRSEASGGGEHDVK